MSSSESLATRGMVPCLHRVRTGVEEIPQELRSKRSDPNRRAQPHSGFFGSMEEKLMFGCAGRCLLGCRASLTVLE